MTERSIARNVSALMISQAVTWILALALTVFLPRYLGPLSTGKLNLANSLWAVAGVGITFGLDTILIKEIAHDSGRVTELVGRALLLRIVMFAVALGCMAAYAHVARYPADTVQVIYVIGLSALVFQCVGVLQGALQGLEQMQYMTIGNIAGKAFYTTVCIALLLRGTSVLVVAWLAMASALVTFAIEWRYLTRLHPIRLQLSLNEARTLLRTGLPFVVSAGFLVVYQQVDVIVISLLVDERAVGWYGAAQQLFGTLLFVPSVFISAIFPSLARLYSSGSNDLTRVMRKSFDLLMLLSIPIGLGVLALGDGLVLLLFGPSFAQSGPILALMGIALIFTYQNMLIGQFLLSVDRPNSWTAVLAAAAICTMCLDWLIIPWCASRFDNGALGGAISYIVTECAIMVAGLRLLPRGTLARSNVQAALRSLAAGLIMFAAVWFVRDLFVAVPIIVGMLVYPMAALALGAVPREDRALVRRLVTGLLPSRRLS